jgi:hypothetical protein
MDMTIVDGHRGVGLIPRAQGILLRPKSEWEIIDTEPATTQALFAGYVCILAAIPAVCALIGGQIFGYGALFFHIHPSLIASITGAVVSYLLALVTTFVLGFIIDALAPSFGGEKIQIQAMKVAAYSGTAGWVAGIFSLFPPIAFIGGLCALYGLYLLYTGLPRVMKSPPEKTMGYTVVTIVCAIVLYIVVAAVMGVVAGPALWGAGMAAAHADSGVVSVNGQSMDLGKIAAATSAAAASAKAMDPSQNGGKTVLAVDPEKLRAFIPDQVDGIPRTALTSQSAGANGVSTSNVEAEYGKDNAHITLHVTDLTAMGAFAGLAGAMGVESTRQTADGYEKVGKVDGRLTTEEWDGAAKSGKYGVRARSLVANRFMVEAEGAAPSIDVLKAAVAAVGPDRLEALAKN